VVIVPTVTKLVFPASGETPASANVTDTWLAQNDMHITAYSAAITIAGTPVAGEPVLFQLSRDVAADDMTGDVKILGLMLEFTTDAATSA